MQQQGDGQLALASVYYHEPRYVDDFFGHLDSELTRHNRSLIAEARIRVRAALHHGVTADPQTGFAGDAVVLAGRLHDSKIARHVVADSDANLALVLSPSLCVDLVVNDHTRLRPAECTQVTIDDDKVDTDAWIWLRGGRLSESIQAARARKSAPGRADGRTAQASSVVNIDRVQADVAYIGSVFHGQGQP